MPVKLSKHNLMTAENNIERYFVMTYAKLCRTINCYISHRMFRGAAVTHENVNFLP